MACSHFIHNGSCSFYCHGFWISVNVANLKTAVSRPVLWFLVPSLKWYLTLLDIWSLRSPQGKLATPRGFCCTRKACSTFPSLILLFVLCLYFPHPFSFFSARIFIWEQQTWRGGQWGRVGQQEWCSMRWHMALPSGAGVVLGPCQHSFSIALWFSCTVAPSAAKLWIFWRKRRERAGRGEWHLGSTCALCEQQPHALRWQKQGKEEAAGKHRGAVRSGCHVTWKLHVAWTLSTRAHSMNKACCHQASQLGGVPQGHTAGWGVGLSFIVGSGACNPSKKITSTAKRIAGFKPKRFLV